MTKVQWKLVRQIATFVFQDATNLEKFENWIGVVNNSPALGVELMAIIDHAKVKEKLTSK